MDALKTANLDLGVPVFASLLSDQLLCIRSLNRDPLCSGSSFVFITGNLELSGQFSDPLGDIMNCLHRVNVGLVQGNLQILGQSLIARLPLSHFHLSAGVVGQGWFQEELNLATITFDDRVCLVKFDTFFKERVNLRTALFLGELFVKYEPCVLGCCSRL